MSISTVPWQTEDERNRVGVFFRQSMPAVADRRGLVTLAPAIAAGMAMAVWMTIKSISQKKRWARTVLPTTKKRFIRFLRTFAESRLLEALALVGSYPTPRPW